MAEQNVVEIPVEQLERALTDIFAGAGCPPAEAAVIAEELALADRMGLGSHGSVRWPAMRSGAKGGLSGYC